MAAPLTDHDANNSALAAETLFSFPAIDSETFLIRSCLAICIEVILKAGSAVLETPFENLGNGAKEPSFLLLT